MSGRKILRRFSSSISDLLSLQKRDASAGEEDEKLNTTPLHNAVQMGNAIMVANFVESRSIWIDEEDGKGRTALHYSMEQFSTDMASILLQNGANVDCVDFNGVSACHIACRDGMIDHFNLLLYYHADVCAIDKSGRTPFDLTCEFGHEKLMDRILTSGVKVECLQRAGDTHTMSALHLAAKNGHVQIVSKLIDHGWDLNRITDQGTALHVAAGFGRTQVVRFLLKAGIDVNGRNFYGQSAYEFAKKNSSKNPITYKEIRFLLKNSKSFVNAIAVKEHCGFKADELSFSPGDNIWVVERNDNGNWKGIVFGQKGNSRCGYFQSSTVAVEKKTPLTAHRVHKKSLSTTDLNLSMSSLSTRMAQSNAVPSTPMPLRHAVKPVPMPTVPMSTFHNPNNHFQQHHHSSSSSSSRSVSDIHYNNGLSTFGRAPSGLSDGSNDSRNGNRRFHSMSQSTFASYGHDANRNGTLTLNGQAMYPSTSALPAGLSPTSGESHRVSTGSNSSYGSSGFESMKCSNSSSSSFLQNSMLNESIGESNPCRSSVHSAGSAGGTSSSSSSGSSSLASTSVHTLDDSFHSASTTAPTPTNINVTQMVTNGVPQAEILANWLDGIGMSEYLSMFLKQGYDLYTIARCTPEDLLSLGIKNPEHRKKLIMDIHGWQIGDAWPNVIPMGGLREWLHQIALAEYVGVFEGQGYKMVQDVLNLTWEDFEDIGIKRLGHLKRLGLAVKKIKDHRRTLANLETVSSNHTQSIAQLSSPILPRGVDRSIASPSGGMNDPPPPAPTNNMEKKLGVHDKIDYISYARGNKVTPPPPPTRNPVPLENRRNVRSSYDALFAEDEPIRLNLVSTGKILSDISKMKDKERDYGFYDTDCPPPPAPLYCEANPLRLLPLRNSMCSNGSASSSDNLPFANENCGTIRAAKDSSKFDIPLTLPPMNIVDTSRDKMVKATDPDGFQEIDDMMQNLVGELDSMIMVNKEKGTTTAAAPIKSALKSEKK